ncbi:MAG: hypothetical protein U5N85_22910 [Arcicella sp.]|nr:hypothetical protein [Arcicella sp.]
MFYLSNNANAQGCSDAGFCTIGVLKGNQPSDNVYKTRWGFNTTVGIADGGVFVSTNSLEYNRNIGKKTFLQIKQPLVITSGELGSALGLGDLSVALNRRIYSQGDTHLDALLATKIAIGSTTFQANGLDLPMPYQTGLGTNDLILGLSYKINQWQFVVGYQQPFGRAKNNFLKDYWQADQVQDYFDSRNLLRKSDILLRIERIVNIHKKWKSSVGVLPILHLGEDEIILKDGNNSILKDSDGLTLNVNLGINYQFNDFNSIRASISAPLLVRDVRPDGLTRVFVIGIGFEHEGVLSSIFHKQR